MACNYIFCAIHLPDISLSDTSFHSIYTQLCKIHFLHFKKKYYWLKIVHNFVDQEFGQGSVCDDSSVYWMSSVILASIQNGLEKKSLCVPNETHNLF